MPSMRPCQSFMSCSSAEKCDLLPTTETVTREIYSICTEMNMAGCENCKIGPNSTYAECDLMSTYSQLCTAMPNMSQCGEFKQMCMMNSDVAFCPSSSASPSFTAPVMQMFFHFSMSDYILFEQWVPRNTAQYTLAWFLVFLAASFYEALNVFSYFQELKWGNVQQHKHDAAVDSAFGPADKRVFSTEKWHGFSNICGLSGGSVGVQQAMLRAMLRMLSTFIGYSLMLIAMTFNVGLFIAIIVGFGVGTFCFVPMIKQSAIPALMGPVGNTECH